MEDVSFSGGEEKYKYFTGMKTGIPSDTMAFLLELKYSNSFGRLFFTFKKSIFLNEDISTLIYARYIEWLMAN